MDNIVIDSSESDSDYEDSSDGHSESEENIYESEHFLNHIKKTQYENNRNTLFTPDLEEIDIFVDSIDKTDVNEYIYELYSNNSKTGGHGEYKAVIGIKLIRACIGQTNTDKEHFVDICIENIPYKACIHNKDGRSVIDRICMTNGSGLLNQNESYEFKENNYFFPITLQKLKVKLMYKFIDNNNDWEKYTSNIHNSFQFRLTLIKNYDLIK